MSTNAALWTGRATAITSMLLKGFRKPGAKQIKTLIEEFEYPRLGPGMMWEAFHAEVERMGGTVVLHAPVQRIEHNGSSIVAIDYGERTSAGESRWAPSCRRCRCASSCRSSTRRRPSRCARPRRG